MTERAELPMTSEHRLPGRSATFEEIPLVQAHRPTSNPEAEFTHLLDWVGEGVAAMEGIEDEGTREGIFALLEGVDVLHRQGLTRLLEVVTAAGGPNVVQRLGDDPIVGRLLQLYDLPAVSERDGVQEALEPVYAYIESHGGKLELLGVEGGRVRVRLSGACGSCPGSAGTLQRVVEESLRAGFPAFTELIAEEPPTPKRTMISLHPTVLRRPRWVDVGRIEDFPPGEMRALWPEGQGVLFVHLDGEMYAHQNGCPPGSALGLHLGELTGSTLRCPWHGCLYDVRTGKRLDAEGKLGVLPVAVQDGAVKVAMGVEEVASA
ncbi:MAG: NifU family protein [Chloroflexota bacterium]